MLWCRLAWSLQISLLALISQRAMSGQVFSCLSALKPIYLLKLQYTYRVLSSGARSFYRRSLHHIGDDQNPYEQAISIIGKTLSKFDDDNLIPCFGFGDGIFVERCVAVTS